MLTEARLREMLEFGLRPRVTAFLTVMEWPDPFVAVAWWGPDPEVADLLSMYEELRQPVWRAASGSASEVTPVH